MYQSSGNYKTTRLSVALILFFGALALSILTVAVVAQDSSISLPDSIADTAAGSGQSSPAKRPLVYTLIIDGAIGVVADERIGDAIDIARKDKAALLIIELDTPGGFMSATGEITRKLLNSPIPVCIYVSPSGARSGSAGVYMTYAASFAAMAPSTNIGSAHPVSGDGKDIDSVMNEKVTNDAVAGIKASAEKRGRNAEWAEKAVRESVNITNSEALELNVIDFIAEDIDDLLAQIDGKETETSRGMVTVSVKNADVERIEMSLMQRLRSIITDPSIVMILFSLGGLGLMMELYNPGTYVPGVIGVICLIVAFYAAQTLPVNYAGVALIFLAIILFIAEIQVISHGLLTLGGVISLTLGGVLLIDDPSPAVQVSYSVLITVAVFALAAVGLLVFLVAKASRRQIFIGEEGMIGRTAIAREKGFVYIGGALWKAECDEPLEPGMKVEIISCTDLVLKVKRINV